MLLLLLFLSVLCDQDDQVVPAHQVDDIDEVHELDPVHQVDHKDEPRFCVEVDSFCALCGRQPRFCVEVVSLCTFCKSQPRFCVDFGSTWVDFGST